MTADQKMQSFYSKSSSEEKVEILFKKYYALLCNGVYRILKDKDLAEDVVQEVFIKIWDKRSTLEIQDNFIFYLKKACYNAALNVIKSDKIHGAFSYDTPEVAHNIPADEDILQEELNQQVLEAISGLPEKTRIVFTLSRYENMSYKEISNHLQVSIKAVEKHMGIALFRLRDSLKDYLYVMILAFLNEL